MQQGRGVDKFDRCGQMDMIRPVIAAHPRRSQGQHRTQAFAARLDQMGGDLGDARGMFRCHAFADHRIDGLKIIRQSRCQLFMWFCCGVIKAHQEFRHVNGQGRSRPVILGYERAFTHQ